MHKVVCGLCSTFYEEEHTFNIYDGDSDETTHCLKCVCSVKSDSREAHDFAYTPNSGTLTHRRACKVCGIRIKNR